MTSNSSTAAEGGPSNTPHRALAFLRVFALVASFTLVWLAWISWPLPPATDLDASSQLVLGYAHERQWQFGPDIIFTHGPWSFLKLVYCYPDTFWDQFIWRICFHAVIAAVVVLVAAKLPLWRAALLIAAAALLLPLFEDVAPALLVAFIFAISAERRLPLVLLLFGAPALAFLALQKLTYLALASVVAIATTAVLLVDGRRRDAAVFLLTLAANFVLFWLGAGQGLWALPTFLSRSWEIVSIYSQAMFLDETVATFWCGIVVLITAGIAFGSLVWRNRSWLPARRWAVALTILTLAFVIWKHAFVRGDGHVQGFFLCALAIGLAFARGIGGLALAAAALTGFAVSSPKLLPKAPALLGLHLETSLRAFASPGAIHANFIEATAAAVQVAQLPNISERVGKNAIDVFGNEPAVALLNNLTYRPRPVFQSYEACSAALAEINADHFAKNDAPRFVLSRAGTIDNRLLAADDARLLIVLLQHYHRTIEENGWSLLERERAGPAPAFRPLAAIEGSLGQQISVPYLPHSLVAAKIDVRPSCLGRLRTFLYKSAELTLIVDDGFGRGAYRLIAPAASGGFVINPLLRDARDYRDFWHGREHTTRTLTVDVAPSARKFYRQSVSVRFTEAPRAVSLPVKSGQNGISMSE